MTGALGRKLLKGRLWEGFSERLWVRNLYGGFVWRILYGGFIWRIWAGILYGGFVWLFKVSKFCMVVLGE